jgi:hypothetical protein
VVVTPTILMAGEGVMVDHFAYAPWSAGGFGASASSSEGQLENAVIVLYEVGEKIPAPLGHPFTE